MNNTSTKLVIINDPENVEITENTIKYWNTTYTILKESSDQYSFMCIEQEVMFVVFLMPEKYYITIQD